MKCNIAIKGLDQSDTESSIKELLRDYGTIIRMKIARKHELGVNYAFVEFSSRKEAKAAIEGVNRLFYEDKRLFAYFYWHNCE